MTLAARIAAKLGSRPPTSRPAPIQNGMPVSGWPDSSASMSPAITIVAAERVTSGGIR